MIKKPKQNKTQKGGAQYSIVPGPVTILKFLEKLIININNNSMGGSCTFIFFLAIKLKREKESLFVFVGQKRVKLF